MKGIAHFVTGIAIATFFPEVVERAAQGSLLPVLGGIAAILPDTLDFKLLRYIQSCDLEIDPGPQPDPQRIAEQLSAAAHQAHRSGEPQRIMLHTIRLGPDSWRRYAVSFRLADGEIVVRTGPVVDTGQQPLPGEPFVATSHAVTLDVPMDCTCDREIVVDIFSGPSLTLDRRDGLLHLQFLDWHRRWSHSLTFGITLALGVGTGLALLQRLSGSSTVPPLWASLLVGLGLLAHVVEDQLGSMGSNLLYPLTEERTPGLGLFRSGDALPNFLTVWTALMLILFNLDRFSAQSHLPPWWAFLGATVLLPALALITFRRRRSQEGEALVRQEILSELEGTGID